MRVAAHEELTLDAGWEAAACAPDAHADPSAPHGGGHPDGRTRSGTGRQALGGLEWMGARVPGTAAAALHMAGRWREGEERDFDAHDWWFRTRFTAAPAAAGEEVVLELDGVATVAEVFLNGTRLLDSDSMFAGHSLDVGGLLRGENELTIRCRALAPLLAQRRKPRARWRTRLVDGNLRFFRTALLGRAPGIAPGPAAVGPWRAVRLVRRRVVAVDELQLRARLDGDCPGAAGLLSVSARLRPLGGGPIEAVEVELRGPSGTHRAALALSAGEGVTGAEEDVTGAGAAVARGTLSVPDVARWWPHTHGEPTLHEVCLHVATATGTVTADGGRVGFRTLAAGTGADHDVEVDGLDLHVNGVRVFARGAVWTPPDPVGLAPTPRALRAALERVRDAGMNMLRVPGTSAYESPAFHELCDELGLLVWQDFMFANLDYPIADERFRATVEDEARAQLDALAGRASLAVLCGNSEIEQQVAMLGLDPALGRGELFGELLPRLVAEAGANAVYVPSAPCGGALPFRGDRGIANYYGVGGYRRPLEDVRRAEVRFAAECLAFSNVPDEAGVAAVLPGEPEHVVVQHPRWKAGVPRDAGSEWDFEDVRDHYLELLFGVDPGELRRDDAERYLELSRAVSGEAMAEVFGEWRRAGSPCGGGLVLWLADLAPGAGWGVVDRAGAPKPAYYHLRRALAPVAVWMTDEGLNGMRAHVANDRPTPLTATLRVALYRDGELRVEEASEALRLPAHGACERDVEALLGHFADVSWAYRFGPPGHDVVVATLERKGAAGEGEALDGEALDGGALDGGALDGGALEVGVRDGEVLSQAFCFPAGRPLRPQSAAELGLEGTLRACAGGTRALVLRSRRVAYGVRVHLPGWRPADDALTLEPGVTRVIPLVPSGDERENQTPSGDERENQAPSGDGHEDQTPAGALTALNLRGRAPLAAEAQTA